MLKCPYSLEQGTGFRPAKYFNKVSFYILNKGELLIMINIAVAIDGPSGAGKSTISRKVAQMIGFIYVDTGALYRAIGYHAFESGVSLENIIQIVELLPNITILLKYEDGVQKIFLNDKDVSKEIRLPNISMYASAASALPEVRAYLLDLQKTLARENNVIMDGRDIGTVILPNAQVKIFLTASVDDRATRRYEELKSSGQDVSYDDIKQDIITRDYNDSNREIAPLKQASDAILVDTTGNELEQSIKLVADIIKKAI